MSDQGKILAIVTSVREYEQVGYRTGLWLGELTHFLDVVEPAGFEVDIASPLGGFVPIDPESLAADVLKDDAIEHRYKDRVFMNRLQNAMKIADTQAADYQAIYLTGGHGVCFDFPKCKELAERIAEFYEAGKVVSAVCHGPAGLLEVRLRDGQYLLAEKNVTGFSWNEEEKVGRDEAVPYDLEEELQRRGAKYSSAWFAFAEHVVEDERLITGQNPASATAVGEAVLKRLQVPQSPRQQQV